MGRLRGITVTLYEKTIAGYDDFNAPIYTETATTIDNVLVAPVSSNDIIDGISLYGKTAQYQLGIPKGDTHTWEDRKVEFFGKTWHTFGFVEEGIEELIPLEWNGKIKVERYG